MVNERLIGQNIEVLTTDGLVFLGVLINIEPNALIIERMVGMNPMEMERIVSFINFQQIVAIRVREMVQPNEN